jgi:hypothetical protein
MLSSFCERLSDRDHNSFGTGRERILKPALWDLRQQRVSSCFLLKGLVPITPGRKRIVPYSIQTLKRLRPESFRRDLIARFDLLQQQKIKPLISQRFPLAEAKTRAGIAREGRRDRQDRARARRVIA